MVLNNVKKDSLHSKTFLVSAIAHEFLIGLNNSLLSQTTINMGYYLIYDTIFSELIYELLNYTNLFHYHPIQALTGLTTFLSVYINSKIKNPRASKDKIKNLLACFQYNKKITNLCLEDMKIENSIGPLILLLKVRRICEKAICNKYITNQIESKLIDYEFNNLVESDLLDTSFLKIQPPWFLRAVSKKGKKFKKNTKY